MLQLFGDTDSDITPAIAAEYNARLISMPYSYDGKTYYPYEDYDVFDWETFYDSLRAGLIPTTSALGKERYINYFEPVFAAGNDILYIHFSRSMSMTFGPMQEAVAELKEKYPERKFYSIDTKGITIISYLIFREIGDMYLNGAGIEQIMEWADREVDHFAQYFFADDLKFFRRSGRVGGLAGTMGTLLGVRPIIYINEEGKMVSLGKERGRDRAIARLVSYADELKDDIMSHRVVIGHTGNTEIAAEIERQLREKFGDGLRIETLMVNPTAGSHCGPDSAGITFHAVHK